MLGVGVRALPEICPLSLTLGGHCPSFTNKEIKIGELEQPFQGLHPSQLAEIESGHRSALAQTGSNWLFFGRYRHMLLNHSSTYFASEL